MTERRYNEGEIAEIFRTATEATTPERTPLPPGQGMTLVELREIGREVGIAPELINRAAQALDGNGSISRRKWLGLPVAVSHTVELGRTLDDAEWERLVANLRQTFDAKGALSHDGRLRQWTNGNLHVYLEPGEHGERLRMRTYKGDTPILVLMGGMFTVLGIVIIAHAFARTALDPGDVIFGTMMGATGLAVAAGTALRLPGWARRRLEQMQAVAARLLTPGGSTPNGPTG
ncbi:MAG TPA: hypothetical protein VFK16_08620 [Gemmatimonadaceae bacterium]|nr:hypothetical protein [Gemmatimonadaceae bacterium]